MSQECQITVRFHAPPADLRRFFTTFYYTEFALSGDETVADSLHPEWAGLRMFDGPGPKSWLAGQAPVQTPFSIAGPTSRAIHFEIGTTRFWGVGLLPLGWEQFAAGAAQGCANLIGDGLTEPAFAPFRLLWQTLFDGTPDEAGELARIVGFFRERSTPLCRDAARIGAIHAALVDPEIGTVSDMVDLVGVGQRTVERICQRAFGFAPKLLLRRQRFLRSLAHYMLDPSLNWIGSLDGQYHDQAQFVRDFKAFMGLSPRQYAALPHPILQPIMRQRMSDAGALDAIDLPTVARYRA